MFCFLFLFLFLPLAFYKNHKFPSRLLFAEVYD